MDDYKDEYLPRLQKSKLYVLLKEACGEKDSEVVSLVEGVVSYAHQRSKTIVKHMGEFTLHDSDHLFRVLFLMEKLLHDSAEKLSVPELMLLISSAFFHDLGMAPSEQEVQTWFKFWDENPDISSEEEKQQFEQFGRFCKARPDQLKKLVKLQMLGEHTELQTLKAYLVTDFIRITHAQRARQIIDKEWSEKIVFRDTNLAAELAQICHSHNEEPTSVLALDDNFLCSGGIVASLPLVAIILRLADILDFDGKRTPKVLFSHLFVRNPVSIKEWSKHRSVDAWVVGPDKIQFSAICTHPAIESSIHEFCDLIDRELSICTNMVLRLNRGEANFQRGLSINLPYRVDRSKIRTKRNITDNEPIYRYKNTKFNLNKQQVIELLMGTKLYGDPEVALRELLQNSIDACLLRKAQEESWGTPYKPVIVVNYETENGVNLLTVEDNGTGMDQHIIDNYYSRVGSSFYKSTEFYNIKSDSKAKFTPTSRFGIGILSCFMVADTLDVDTKRLIGPHNSTEALHISVEGEESIFWIKKGKRDVPGTTTKLFLREAANPWENLSEDQFIESVENVIPNPPFTITIKTSSHEQTRDENSFALIKPTSLRGGSWQNHENIREFDIELNSDKGVKGLVTIGILEKDGVPVFEIELSAKTVEIEGASYTLERKMSVQTGSIIESGKTITIDAEGEVREDSSYGDLAKSRARISLHGIEVPTDLFPPNYIRKRNQVKLIWPFSILIVVDVCGGRDLELNSPRTEIIMGDKWNDFETHLAYQVCSGLSEQVKEDYWQQFYQLFKSNSKSDCFLNGLEQANKERIEIQERKSQAENK